MTYDPVLALSLGLYAADAYKAYRDDAFFMGGYLRVNGKIEQAYSRDRWLERNHYKLIVNPAGTDDGTKYRGIVATTSDSVVVAFRGTETLDDWVIDAWGGDVVNFRTAFPFSTWTLGPTTTWVHTNFLTTYLGVQASVRQTVQQLFDANPALTKLYVTGHSLGGALAMICALDLATGLAVTDPKVPVPQLYTFAAPRVGDQQFAAAVNAHVPQTYRVEQPNDWVPTVPSIGWTPAWMAWWAGGQVGPAPKPALQPYVQPGVVTTINTLASFWWCHYMDNYYAGCEALIPVTSSPTFSPTTPITKLVIRIKTADTLGGGTDNDVFANLLGVSWGPLDNPGNDFEAGETGEYDLFAMFPSKVPANPTCGQLTSVGLGLGGGIFYFEVYNMAWDPEWVEVVVNGSTFAKAYFNETLTGYSNSNYASRPITIP